MDPACSYEAILQRASEGLAKVTEALDLNEEGPADKRRAPRFTRGGTLPVFPYAGGNVREAIRAHFRDASAQGIGMVVPESLAVGSQFIIRLPQKKGQPLPLLYTVVRCNRQGEKEFRVGAELTCVLRQHDAVDQKPIDERDVGLECIRKAILASA
jgi:hypothetical protein